MLRDEDLPGTSYGGLHISSPTITSNKTTISNKKNINHWKISLALPVEVRCYISCVNTVVDVTCNNNGREWGFTYPLVKSETLLSSGPLHPRIYDTRQTAAASLSCLAWASPKALPAFRTRSPPRQPHFPEPSFSRKPLKTKFVKSKSRVKDFLEIKVLEANITTLV